LPNIKRVIGFHEIPASAGDINNMPGTNVVPQLLQAKVAA
jgi:hypothetical protein